MDIASVRTPADAANMENVFMMPSFNKNTIWRYSNKNEAIATLLMGNSKVRVTEFGWQGATNNDYTWNHDIHTTDDFKTAGKYRVVLDQTSAEKDHLRIYTNGNLASVTATRFAERLPGHPRTGDVIYDLGGVGYNGTAYNLPDTIYGLWCGMNRADVYIDNFTAYLVDPFAVESVEGNGNVFNTAKGAVTYTFSQPVDAETAIANNTVVLVDEAGEIVAGGIKSIGLDDAGYKMIVKLSDTLPGLTKYSIKLTTGLEDIYGNCISPKYEFKTYTPAADSGIIKNADGTVTYNYTDSKGTTHTLTTQGDCYVKSPTMMKTVIDLTTSKATSLFAEATQAVVNGSTVTTTVKFTTPEVTPMGVWCVVAVFGDYNEMLGCTAVDVTEVEASDSTDDIPVTITTNGGTVKSVRMFVWNSAEDMKPYQKAEEIK